MSTANHIYTRREGLILLLLGLILALKTEGVVTQRVDSKASSLQLMVFAFRHVMSPGVCPEGLVLQILSAVNPLDRPLRSIVF